MAPNPTIFLDRDGVINPDVGYPHRPADAVLFPDVAPALRRLHAAGHRLVVVSNQSGIARGYYTLEQAKQFNQLLALALADFGVPIEADHFFMCPHRPSDACDCRKPKPGLLLAAADRLNIDLSESYLVGDAESDIDAGRAVGVTTIRLNRQESTLITRACRVVHSLTEAADWLLDREAARKAFRGEDQGRAE